MDSAPAGATRMGSRSSTRHGGPAQIFVGPVRKWRKVWAPVASSAPTPSANRVVLYKWTPLTPSNGSGGAKEDSAVPEETIPPPARPVKYIPIVAVIQKNKEEIARKAAEEVEAQAQTQTQTQAENETQEAKETTTTVTDMVIDTKQPDSAENEEKTEDQPMTSEPQAT